MGKTKEEIESSPLIYLGPLITAFVSALVLALIVEAFAAYQLVVFAVQGIVFALW
jgi:hypothetical protein